jgi:hypothetical protein
MFFRRLKALSHFLVMVLAMLQILLPLIHAHPVGSSVGMTAGIHMPAEEFEIPDLDKTPAIKAQHYLPQVIGVAGGREPEQRTLLAATLICVFVIALWVFLPANAVFLLPAAIFHARRPPRYVSLPLRAPPF